MTWLDLPPDTGFGLDNLPLGIFSTAGTAPRTGVRVGDSVLDLWAAGHGEHHRTGSLNAFLARGPEAWQYLRVRLRNELADEAYRAAIEPFLVPIRDATMHLPIEVADYVDFYSSQQHAENVGRIFRPGSDPLPPNWKHLPIGYHGRAGTVAVSGTPVRRPSGQRKAADDAVPTFGPSTRLDIEAELGFVVGAPSSDPVPVGAFADHVFGVCLLNDWSARDLQAWEYQPLGPFLAKSFTSTLSPWVVTMEALAPFRAPLVRPEGDPRPLPYLDSEQTWRAGGLDVQVDVTLQTLAMRQRGLAPVRLARSFTRDAAYWTPGQLIAHHTSNGCNLRPGDLLGSGTLSGAGADQAGSLLEITSGGKHPIRLPGGETRTFLEDGDTLALAAVCESEGARRIGFGACSGTIQPAHSRG